MKENNEDVLMTEEGFALNFRPRASSTLSLPVPKDTLTALERVAAGRDMSVEALLKLYIGQGLRQDIAQSFAEHLLTKTEQILTHHLQSEEAVSSILEEIRLEATT